MPILKVTILDYNKRFSDNSLAITDIVDLILDYNSIRIQTINIEYQIDSWLSE